MMALRFEPTRFFLKGKVRQKKQATYINTVRKLVRCEMNTKEEDIKSRVRYPGMSKRKLIMNIEVPGVMAGGRDYEISEKQ